MPTFAYTAVDARGNAAAGSVVGETPAAARRKLETGGLVVRNLEPLGGGPAKLEYAERPGVRAKTAAVVQSVARRGGRVPTKAVTGFYRDLATMLDAGIGVRESLRTLLGQAAATSATWLGVVRQIGRHVDDGGTLGEGMALFPNVFDQLEVRAVEAGELAGILDESLRRLAALRENSARLRGRLVSALTYPAVVVGIALAITVLLFTFVVPTMLEPIVKAGRPLPLPTLIVKAVSDALLYWWWLLIPGVVLGAWLLRRYLRTDAGRRAWDALVLKLPIFGGLVLKHTVARTATLVATLLRSGIGLVESLQVAERTCANTTLAAAIGRWEDAVQDGEAPDAALRATRAFPPLMEEMVAVGTQTGKMEDTLDKLSETYEQQVAETADRLASLLEPALVVVLGGLVLLIALAVLLPLLSIYSILGA